MSERTVELDTPELRDVAADVVREATERAERAEAELARLRSRSAAGVSDAGGLKEPPSPSTAASGVNPDADAGERGSANAGGLDELRKDSMMAHLLDALEAGTDIGHYGRLVFAMVARHFLPHAEVMAWLTRDRDFSEEQAELMLRQVEGRDYSPPRRERILEWQREQEFPILDPKDPDSGNLYRNLKFPDEVYEHIVHYQEAKAATDGGLKARLAEAAEQSGIEVQSLGGDDAYRVRVGMQRVEQEVPGVRGNRRWNTGER